MLLILLCLQHGGAHSHFEVLFHCQSNILHSRPASNDFKPASYYVVLQPAISRCFSPPSMKSHR